MVLALGCNMHHHIRCIRRQYCNIIVLKKSCARAKCMANIVWRLAWFSCYVNSRLDCILSKQKI